ncbi:hypothetical protein BGZ98_009091 [Dissophora globulifera]|nr:hypothetical protein BGZ98_009091 [Dissophora globulifera]
MASSTQLQEDYALYPALRPQLVKATTPGTEDHLLYRLQLLSQQLQTGEVPVTVQAIDEAMALLTAAQNSNVVMDVPRLRRLHTQIAVLAFPVKPDILLKQIGYDPSMIGISQPQDEGEADHNTDDNQDEAALSNGVESLPTTLDQDLIKTEVLTTKLLDKLEQNYYGTTVPKEAWPHLFAQPRFEEVLEKLKSEQIYSLFNNLDTQYSAKSLEIIGKADLSQFDRVVVKMLLRLLNDHQIAFTYSVSNFQKLTRAQLDMIKEKSPGIMNDEGFVGLVERRIVPESFADNEELAYEAWLGRMMDFVEELSSKFNLHKLSVYLLSLEHDLAKGVKDKAKFMKVQPATADRDDVIVREYLTHFMREAKSSTEFQEFFESHSFLDPLLARVMLNAGDADVAKWSTLLSTHESLTQFTENTILKFSPDNPKRFLPSDPVVFKLRAKNAKRILVRVFEVKTFEYLQQHDGAIMGQKLNLDGLTPNWEHSLILDHPPLEMHEVLIELPELENRRGAFVMDVISNGENSCAYFTKGCLDYIERQSVAGHILTIIDENQEKLSENCTVWLNGYYYKPNGDGDIIIPYRKPSSSNSEYVYIIHDGFATRKAFDHRVEEYSFKFACHIDHESLVAGAKAKVVVKPMVHIQDDMVVCPVSLLEQVQLTIASYDTNNIMSTTTVPDFKVFDIDWSEYNFQVPENLASIKVTLAAKIKVISTGEHQDLTISRHFAFDNPVPDFLMSFDQKGSWQVARIPGEIVTVLQKTSDGYKVLALGKNGEKRSNTPLDFDIEHPIWKERIIVVLRSDENGQIHLGPLQDIEKLTCRTTQMSWHISGREQYQYPRNINALEGEVISLPIGQHQNLLTVRSIALFSVSERSSDATQETLDDHTDNVRLEKGLLSIRGLKPGYYIFRIGTLYEEFAITVANASTPRSKIPGLEEFVIGSNPMLELMDSTKDPLYISEPVADAVSRKVDIQLYNWSTETRVCVFASKFVPYGDTALDRLCMLPSEEPWSGTKTELTPLSFKTGRVLGEEYQYILNRKTNSNHWAGNLLTKPSVLLTPWSIADTTMSKQEMKADRLDDVRTTTSANLPGSLGRSRDFESLKKKKASMRGASRASPLLNFLVHASVALVNLIPDEATGMVSIPYAAFKEGAFLEIFAMDGSQAAQQSFAIPRSSRGYDFQKRDLRFKSQLDHTKHYIGERTGINLDPTQKVTPADGVSEHDSASVTLSSNGSSSSAVKVINSVSQVYDLMLTLLSAEDGKQTLRKFGFITDWDRLSIESKKQKYSKWNCHELNLFLAKKDPDFFDSVIVPFIKNKLMKSFMDEYFIGAPLEKYVALHEFNSLTCLEKCLLAHRVPSVRASVVQWLKDRMQNPRAASNVKLFLTVMNSGNLKESPPGGPSMNSPTSPQYSPTSPNYSPTSPQYVASSDEEVVVETVMEEEESDDDMGFGLFDAPSPPMAAMSLMASAPPAAPSNVRFKQTARMSTGDMMRSRNRSEQMLQGRFKAVELTQEMAETYYYGRQDFKIEYEDPNLFWLDLAQWDDSKGNLFLSRNFVINTGTFTDAMATIALLDVTFRPTDVSLGRAADQNLVISSQSPAIVFHSSTKELTESLVAGSVLVTEQYFEQTDKIVYNETMMTNVRQYIQSGAEFRPLDSYGAHVVLMNSTSNPMKVHLEVQIPQGSISIYGSLESGQDIQLEPHGTFQYEYGFYFPEQGDFPHYPAHVSNYEDIIAYAAPSVLKVRHPEPDRKETDKSIWSHVLKRGTRNDILAKLATSPMSSLPVPELLPRLYKDRRLLQQVTSLLRSRQEYNQQIWLVGLAFNLQDLAREFFMNQTASYLDVGDWFESPVLVKKPHSRLDGSWDQSFKYLEYFPLINARAHKATRNATILNDKFKGQYNRFLRLLSQKPQHGIDDLLVLIVYLLAQDRIMEAKERYERLAQLVQAPSSSIEYMQRLQFDYLGAYLSLCVEVQTNDGSGIGESLLGVDLVEIQKVLDTYKDHPVERWSKMFKDMQQYVDEIVESLTEIDTADQQQQQSGSASEDPSTSQQQYAVEQEEEEEGDNGLDVPVTVDFKIGSQSVVTVRHRGVRTVTVEYYSIDAETMFSASPLTLSDQGETDSNSSSVDSLSPSSSPSNPFGATPFGRVNNYDNTHQSSGSDSSDSSNSYRLVKPNGIDSHPVKRAVANDGILMIPILPQYLNTNVMISVSTSPPAATRTWRAYYSQTILVQCLEKTGTIKVISKSNESSSGGRPTPIRGAYVKVYAEMKQGGDAVFWKDGYTDLVGRFAYAQVSTDVATGSGAGGALGDVKRFAVFVDGGRDGCVVKTLPVPPV